MLHQYKHAMLLVPSITTILNCCHGQVADMRDAMALQLQTVVSAYSEELAALQGQMLQIEGMSASTAQEARLGSGLVSGRVEAESVGWRAAYEVSEL